MSTLKEITAAIRDLPEMKVWQLGNWLDEYRAALWDKELDEDAAAGRLDFLFEEAKAERKDGKRGARRRQDNHMPRGRK